MRYKVGDRVRIKNIDWYNKNKSKSHGTVACGSKYFDYDMREWCGKTMTILDAYQTCYIMKEDGAKDLWTDEMIEGLSEEIERDHEDKIFSEGYDQGYEDGQHDMNEWVLPEGFQFKDENGNLINAQKIVLEKMDNGYPKTYEECVEILGRSADVTYGYKKYVLHIFQMLLVCRDAYWLIAGEEMGLGRPWEPDWTNEEWPDMAYISYDGKSIDKENGFPCCNMILIFPTEEMRDAFYENFKELIESVKELL